MTNFRKDFDEFCREMLESHGFYGELNEGRELTGYYRRFKDNVHQYICIKYFKDNRIDVSYQLNKQMTNIYDYRRAIYYKHRIKNGKRTCINVDVYECDELEWPEGILSEIFHLIEQEIIPLMDNRLKDFIIRQGWNTELNERFEQLLGNYEEKYRFPLTIEEMSNQISEEFSKREHASENEIKEMIIELSAVYTEYFKRNYTEVVRFSYKKLKFSDVFIGRLKLKRKFMGEDSGYRQVIFHPVAVLYRTWMTKDMDNLVYMELYELNKDKEYIKIVECKCTKELITIEKVK